LSNNQSNLSKHTSKNLSSKRKLTEEPNITQMRCQMVHPSILGCDRYVGRLPSDAPCT
jgi:hypothetical protein